jgi:hypothetical protein
MGVFIHTHIHICSFRVENKREFNDLFTLLEILNIKSWSFYTSSFRLYGDYRTAYSDLQLCSPIFHVPLDVIVCYTIM